MMCRLGLQSLCFVLYFGLILDSLFKKLGALATWESCWMIPFPPFL